jgi:signal transduction histidine kinase
VLHTTGLLLLQDAEADVICQQVFEAIREPLEIDCYFHYLVAPEGTHLELASSGGNDIIRSMLGTPLDFGQAVCGTVAGRCEGMHVRYVQHSNDAMTSIIRSVGVRAYSCSPLMLDGRVLGTLSFGSTERDFFEHEEIQLFGLIAQQVTLATDRRQRQEHLRYVEQLATAGRMSAALAHEINNPLESLATVLYLLRDEVQSEEAREHLQMAEAQVSKLAETTRRTLEMFRGKMPLAAPVNVSGLAEELVRDIRLPRDVGLRSEIDPGLCVRAVAGELRQVLFNLLLNAAAYSPLRAVVTLKVKRVGEHCEIRVRDEGPGILEESRARIFEPFYTTRRKGGTGIGLWISKEMIERYGGTLTFETEAGVGTEFLARLPLVK